MERKAKKKEGEFNRRRKTRTDAVTDWRREEEIREYGRERDGRRGEVKVQFCFYSSMCVRVIILF